MKKAQIITLSVCALGAVILLAAGWTLARGVLRYQAAVEALNHARRQLQGYYQETVFPSAANVRREQENISRIERWFDDLSISLRKGNVISNERSPSRFVGILERTRERLMREAQAAGTEVPEAFAFGFERYTGTGALPRPDDVPRLTEQLILVNRICRILFDQRVKALKTVERAVFEDGGSQAPPPVANESAGGRRAAAIRRSASPTPTSGNTITDARAGLISEGQLFGRYRFMLEFTAKETALIGILNALAASPAFTVVRTIWLNKDVPVLIPSALETLPSSSPPITAGVAPPPPESAAKLRLGPNYPVSGLEMEIPMSVRIELDVYKFKGTANASGE